jgi:phospholipase/lecithinase/hemolysin
MNHLDRSRRRPVLAAAVLVLLLSACGGGGPDVPGSAETSGAPTTRGTFTRLVVFGDSLSDTGAYAPATSLAGNGTAPYFGGKFTVNGPGDRTWVENLAVTLGIVVTPHEVGFAGQSVKCPAAANPALASSCTSYAQGGARVTSPDGIGRATGALTVPMRTQIANHLARFTNFTAGDLIVLWGGNNDAFVQFGAFTAQATAIQTDAAAGRITADEANRRLFSAQTAAQQAMKDAALELAGYVKSEILAKGGRYVAVFNLPDSAQTPFGSTLPATVRPVLTTLVETFNLWLRDGLAGQPVQIVDQFAAGRDVYANPARYGFANNTIPVCDATKISAITGGRVTDGSSLFCNSTPGVPFNGVRDGASTTTWQFADGVHPTPGGHTAISNFVTQQFRSYGWIQ